MRFLRRTFLWFMGGLGLFGVAYRKPLPPAPSDPVGFFDDGYLDDAHAGEPDEPFDPDDTGVPGDGMRPF